MSSNDRPMFDPSRRANDSTHVGIRVGLCLVYTRCPTPPPPVVEFVADTLTFGRGAEHHVALGDDRSVSRHHARFERRGERVYVVDQNSTNGTWVDGVRTREAMLRNGAIVRIGTSVFRFITGDLVAHQRQENLALLVHDLLHEAKRPYLDPTIEVMEALAAHAYPYQASVLARVIRAAVAQAKGNALSAKHLPESMRPVERVPSEVPENGEEPTASVRLPRVRASKASGSRAAR